MKTEKINIPSISQEKFFSLWEETWVKNIDDEKKLYDFFNPIIDSIPNFALGEYYWQIFYNSQPFPKIVMADGAVNKLTPSATAQELCGLSVEEFFSYYHQEDLMCILSFLSKIFRIIIDDKPSNRKNYNITMFARIRNGEGEYLWNSLQYPALYFDENDQFLYGMALYTNINHLMKADAEPVMTVLYADQPNNQKLMQYSLSNIDGIQKNYPNVSPREREIIILLGKGNSSKQIADILGITKNTVDNHRQRLLKKFDVKSSSELVVKAMIY